MPGLGGIPGLGGMPGGLGGMHGGLGGMQGLGGGLHSARPPCCSTCPSRTAPSLGGLPPHPLYPPRFAQTDVDSEAGCSSEGIGESIVSWFVDDVPRSHRGRADPEWLRRAVAGEPKKKKK